MIPLLLLGALLVGKNGSFVLTNDFYKNSARIHKYNLPQRLMMISDVSMTLGNDQTDNLLTALAIQESLVESSSLEAHAVKISSHVVSAGTIFLRHATVALRLATVADRTLCILSDYVTPDHSLNTELFVFQLAMILRECRGLIRVVLPLLLAAYSSKSIFSSRDRRVFVSLFRPVGVTLRQYKNMVLSSCFDWISAEKNEIIHYPDDNKSNCYVYWLHSGTVDVQTHKNEQFSKRAHHHNIGMGLIGEMNLVRRVQYDQLRCKKAEATGTHLPVTIKAGKNGATLLRINVDELMKQMKQDKGLHQSISLLLMKETEKKLSMMVKASDI